jgi:hypothetical protein
MHNACPLGEHAVDVGVPVGDPVPVADDPQALGVHIHDGERSDVGMCLIQGQERFSEAEPDDRDPERTVHGHALRFRTCGQ